MLAPSAVHVLVVQDEVLVHAVDSLPEVLVQVLQDVGFHHLRLLEEVVQDEVMRHQELVHVDHHHSKMLPQPLGLRQTLYCAVLGEASILLKSALMNSNSTLGLLRTQSKNLQESFPAGKDKETPPSDSPLDDVLVVLIEEQQDELDHLDRCGLLHDLHDGFLGLDHLPDGHEGVLDLPH